MIRVRSFVVFLACFLSNGCGTTVVAPDDFASWSEYPREAVRISGPTPRFIAFLAPFDEVRGTQRSVIVATNNGSTTSHLFYGPCAFGLRLYTSAAFNTPPVWDNRQDACELIGVSLDIPAGETRTRPVFGFIQPDALGDSLPPRRYYAAVTWRRGIDSPVELVPAGSIYVGRNP